MKKQTRKPATKTLRYEPPTRHTPEPIIEPDLRDQAPVEPPPCDPPACDPSAAV